MKIKKRILPVILSVFLLMAFICPVFAGESISRVVDSADILNDTEEEKLRDKLNEISEKYQCDVSVVTEASINGQDPQDYADDYFDYFGYGMGEDKSGILLLVTMEERKWQISTHGSAIDIFSESRLQEISDSFISDLSDGDYYEAFKKYARGCEDYLSGKNHTGGNNWGMRILISLGVGFICALIVSGVMRSQMKTVRMNPDARDYLKEGSLQVTKSRDLYLYSQVIRTEKPKADSSGSIHTSSSGQTHGGSGGSF
ncbi:MAG: TPM domain-containing protein [Clostridia bacterium]|nr:TPM domain-containing protein [Clostridia bacterium]MDY5554989.1 TPM domain-containing protein [Blautia sp.]